MKNSFSVLGLSDTLANALLSMGYVQATPIQQIAIPSILENKNCIIEADTGTGKTLAYLAPALQILSSPNALTQGSPNLIIVSPTEELATQIGRVGKKLIGEAHLQYGITVILGGSSVEKQMTKLHLKPEIIVATLGRLHDLMRLGRISGRSLLHLVLDEADRLLSKDCESHTCYILGQAGKECRCIFVSATLSAKLREKIQSLVGPCNDIQLNMGSVLADDITHWCFLCESRKRLDFLRKLHRALSFKRCLVFLSQANRAQYVAEMLCSYNIAAGYIHSAMDKQDRARTMTLFGDGRINLLITSDLTSRGIDIPDIDHVVSLDIPEETTVYTHRAGRTGRAGAKGVSIVMADAVELRRVSKIAVRGNFVFRCKELYSGLVHEVEVEEFFKKAELLFARRK